MELDKSTLTRIYNEANNIGAGKNPPISTEFIFNAMRASYAAGVNSERERVSIKITTGKQINEAWDNLCCQLLDDVRKGGE